MPRLDGPLLSLATRQDGLLTRHQLLAAGWSGGRITRACSDWPRILPGVFLTDARPVDVDVRCRAVAMRWPDAVLCQDTAGRRRGWPFLTRLPDWAPWLAPGCLAEPEIHFICDGQRRPPAGYRAHRREPGRPALVRGIAVTDVLTTLVDVARTSPLPVAVVVIDHVCRATGMRLEEVRRAAAASVARRGRKSAVAAAGLAREGVESALETLARLLLVLAGLPEPEVQLEVRCSGWAYRADLGYRERRLLIELDGRDFHSEWDAVMKDMARQNVLVAQGWSVLRFSWRQVMFQPQLVVEAVARALAAA